MSKTYMMGEEVVEKLFQNQKQEYGRNYVKNGDFSNGLNDWNNWGSGITRQIVDGKLGKKWANLITTDVASFRGIRQILKFEPNTEYTVSFMAYSVGNSEINLIVQQIGEGNNDPQIRHTASNINESPQKISYTFRSVDNDAKSSFQLMIGGSYSSPHEIFITEIQFEKGNTVTDWSPAPEDLINSLKPRTYSLSII